jgi:hypothetical protein
MTKEEYSLMVFKSEDQFTAATHKYINHNYPALRGFYFHVANESATGMAMRLKLHSMGVLSGVMDFLFVYPFFWGLELKMPNGKLSDKQKHLHNHWASVGITVVTAYSAEDVIKALTKL